jgi:predicted molibdopterin-dependent oxidoreductase YjgC
MVARRVVELDGPDAPVEARRPRERPRLLREAAHGADALGIFSCSKSTNEVNFLAQKLARVGFGTNNIDSCNRT